MKNQLLIVLTFFSLSLCGQDDQWFVLNGTTNSQFFKIDSVNHPWDWNTDPGIDEKNDILIIYSDGTFFNSRASANFSLPYNIGRDYCLDTGPGLGKTIEYLYFTNKYEGDDWPPGIVAPDISTSANCQNPDNLLDVRPTLDAPPISSNHSIVPGKDITVIINKDSLDMDCEYELCYNKIPGRDDLDILEPSNVFNSESSFSFPQGVHLPHFGNCIKLNLNLTGDYLFFNFSCSDQVHPGLIGTEVNFQINNLSEDDRKCGNFLLPEKIDIAHDPNFVRVDSICQNDLGTFVNYHVEFFNDGTAPAGNLKIENLEIPLALDPSCIKVTNWQVGMASMASSPLFVMIPCVDGNNLSFSFNTSDLVYPYSSANPNSCIGFVEFCIRAKPGYNILDYGTSLYMGIPNTMFDTQDYPINDFIDPYTCDPNPNLQDSNCTRPIKSNCDCECGTIKKPKNCWLFNFFKKKKKYRNASVYQYP